MASNWLVYMLGWYIVGTPHLHWIMVKLQYIMSSYDRWKFPTFSKGHRQSPYMALSAGKGLWLGQHTRRLWKSLPSSSVLFPCGQAITALQARAPVHIKLLSPWTWQRLAHSTATVQLLHKNSRNLHNITRSHTGTAGGGVSSFSNQL